VYTLLLRVYLILRANHNYFIEYKNIFYPQGYALPLLLPLSGGSYLLCKADGLLFTPQHFGLDLSFFLPLSLSSICKKAKLQARIKPTALYSVIDKENLIESPLDFLHYLYNYHMVYALLSHAYHVTHHVMSCDVMLWLSVMWLWLCDTCDVTLSCTPFCVVSPR